MGRLLRKLGSTLFKPRKGVLESLLVARTKSGDLSAFEEIVSMYEDMICRIAMAILSNRMDAEETAQDVFLTIFEKIDTFKGEAHFSTWVYRITVNAALMRLRREQKASYVPLDDLLPEFNDMGKMVSHINDWSRQADEVFLRDEAKEIIHAAVDKLEEKYKTVFILRDVENLSNEETASILELSIPAVKSRLHRARLFLRKELSSYFEEYCTG